MGSTTSKGVLIQAKRLDKIARNDLVEQCRRMNLITKKGSVVWLYDKTGIKVARSPDVERGSMAPFGNAEFLERVLKCSIGDKRKVPNGQFGDRRAQREMLEALGAQKAERTRDVEG